MSRYKNKRRVRINYKLNPKTKKKSEMAYNEEDALEGIFEGGDKNFGFVRVEGYDEDFFIGKDYKSNAFYGDKVLIVPLTEKELLSSKRYESGKSKKRTEAKIVKILERTTKTVVGYFENNGKFGFVLPDNKKIGTDIFVPKAQMRNAKTGHKVVCEITIYPDGDRKPEGKITQVLGLASNPKTQVTSIVKSYGIPDSFPDEVLLETERIDLYVDERKTRGREDLRDVFTITIDGDDAKDLDDAITIEKNEDGFVLGVHIADVSEYVKEGSYLDKEALKRGTSVYFADRVIPMLPTTLSNGICSLNQKEDRLALSCIMNVDNKGKVTSHRIVESVINVNKRCSYNEIYAIMKEEDCDYFNNASDELKSMTADMLNLSDIIREKRYERGAIDFDLPESDIILDSHDRVVDIKPHVRNRAMKIIEDFMLLANETVAEHFFWMDSPFVYRYHEKPDSEKMKELSTFIKNLGFGIHIKEDVHPKELQKLLDKIEGSDAENLISKVTLRSMQKAMYGTTCIGHFGLAAKYYCHFTSPIRRYPDLQIHRIIKEHIHKEFDDKRRKHYIDLLPDVCKNSSALERRADEAEREVEKYEKVMFMKDKIGQIYEGTISGVTKWGLFVELSNTVEGLVRITYLTDDTYELDEKHYELYGRSRGKRYKLGQKLKVWVYDIDSVMKTIDFKLANDYEE